jgi:surface protein
MQKTLALIENPTNQASMASSAKAFNQDLGSWNVASVTNMLSNSRGAQMCEDRGESCHARDQGGQYGSVEESGGPEPSTSPRERI